MPRCAAFLFLLAALLPAAAAGAPPLVLQQATQRSSMPLGLHLDILHDEKNELTFTDITTPNYHNSFTQSTAKTLNFGFIHGTYWVRFQVSNASQKDKNLLLEAAFPLIDRIDLYAPKKGREYAVIENGELIPFEQRPLPHRTPVFPILIPKETSQTYYLRFQDSGSVPLPLILWEPSAFLEKTTHQQLLFGLYYGGLLAIILYNIVIFAVVRIRSYLYYIVFVAIYLLWQLVYNGLANQYLWPQAGWLSHRIIPLIICATGISALQFARAFLDTPKNVPLIDRLLSSLMFGFGIIFLLALNPGFTGSIALAALTSVLFAIAALFTCFYCWKIGIRSARFFSIAWFALLTGTALLGLKSLGFLPSNVLTEYGQQFGSILEISLFSLALADQLRTMRLEKEKAQATALLIEQKAKLQLEEKVNQRTHDLHEKNQQLQLLATKLAKYLDPQVYAAIFSGKADVKIHSYRKKLTIFFSDIKGFTELTDSLESESLTTILNEYLNEMAEIALAYGGTIDKYIGDAIMVFFGDPETRGEAEDAVACVKMAITMQKRMKELQQKWQGQLLPNPLCIRVGINSGFCTVGNFGSENRLDYTIVGGQVNLASRLESNAEPDEILISYQTYALIKDVVACEKKEAIRVKGIAHPVHTYQVIDLHENLAQEKNAIKAAGEGYDISFDFNRISKTARNGLSQTLENIVSRLQHG